MGTCLARGCQDDAEGKLKVRITDDTVFLGTEGFETSADEKYRVLG